VCSLLLDDTAHVAVATGGAAAETLLKSSWEAHNDNTIAKLRMNMGAKKKKRLQCSNENDRMLHDTCKTQNNIERKRGREQEEGLGETHVC
jgi:hypothetical protein